MSGNRPRSHAAIWSLGVIAALLLYVLSWGPVTVHYSVYHSWGSMEMMINEAPAWAKTLYAPVDWLRGNSFFCELTNHYLDWCYRMKS